MTIAFTSIGHDSNIFNVSKLLAIVNAADFSLKIAKMRWQSQYLWCFRYSNIGPCVYN